MSVDFEDDSWRAIVALAFRLCNQETWVLETPVGGYPIWHKMTGKTTYCGGRITRTPITKTATNVKPPPEADQCIICQFGAQRLFLIPGGKPSVPPKKDPEPDPTPPEGPYTPNPPTGALTEGPVLKQLAA